MFVKTMLELCQAPEDSSAEPWPEQVRAHHPLCSGCPLLKWLLCSPFDSWWAIAHHLPAPSHTQSRRVSQGREGVCHFIRMEVWHFCTWTHTVPVCLYLVSLRLITPKGISGSHLVYSSASLPSTSKTTLDTGKTAGSLFLKNSQMGRCFCLSRFPKKFFGATVRKVCCMVYLWFSHIK